MYKEMSICHIKNDEMGRDNEKQMKNLSLNCRFAIFLISVNRFFFSPRFSWRFNEKQELLIEQSWIFFIEIWGFFVTPQRIWWVLFLMQRVSFNRKQKSVPSRRWFACRLWKTSVHFGGFVFICIMGRGFRYEMIAEERYPRFGYGL